MKVALVHDWLDTWAGGEQCLEQIVALYPDATIFALVDFLPDRYRERLGGRHARTSFLQRVPGARRHFRRYLPLFPAAIERLDVAGFDLVVSTSHAVAKGVRTQRSQMHVCYCLSPIRYAWDLRDQYLAQVGLDRGARGWAAQRVLDRLAAWDARSSERVTEFIAISHHIAARIARCYGRVSEVIYPPVRLPSPVMNAARAGTYVTVSRLVPYKRIDVIAAAFRLLPDRELAIVGEGPERERIVAAAGPNVRMLGQLDDAARDALLRNARAFVFAADEDFGIAPVEAHAMGTPVIGYRSGGLLETVAGLEADAPTGVFFDAQKPEAIAEAIRVFERNAQRITPQACRRSAERFSAERFRSEFSAFIAERWAAFRQAAKPL